MPVVSTATPRGWLNPAATPWPSANVAVPEPAMVVTATGAASLRMTLLPESVIYKFPKESIVTHDGLANPLAMVLTTPSDVILRTPPSELPMTYTSPEAFTVIP